MALPTKVTFVSFDVYGTLIDWETGIRDAFQREAQREGFSFDRPDDLLRRFHEISREIEAGSYELYAEVLRRTAVRIAKDVGWDLEPSRAGFLPDSVPRWLPFRET
ncbi:MAG TPA: haloacid dehalogenase, partial [Solirubrobacteraceae bacterium]|nr:haloacid dehalogenase [Solirubrobacteraceae bacterium]